MQKIADYIMTLFEQGATLLNINIVNGQQILEADKDPSKYPNLVACRLRDSADRSQY